MPVLRYRDPETGEIKTVGAPVADEPIAKQHINNKNNPHEVTLSQLGVNISADEINLLEGVTSNIQEQLDNISDTFYVTPYQTTFSEIQEAFEDGKDVKCVINGDSNAIFPLVTFSSDQAEFFVGSGAGAISITVSSSDVWEFQEIEGVLSVCGKTGEVELNYTDINNLQDQLNAKVPTTRKVNNKALSADITLTASDVGAATESYVDNKVASLVDSAPGTLDTLNELAAALGDDPNFATTVATEIGKKVDKVTGKGLSTNDYTNAEKNKLAGIDENASKIFTETIYIPARNFGEYQEWNSNNIATINVNGVDTSSVIGLFPQPSASEEELELLRKADLQVVGVGYDCIYIKANGTIGDISIPVFAISFGKDSVDNLTDGAGFVGFGSNSRFYNHTHNVTITGSNTASNVTASGSVSVPKVTKSANYAKITPADDTFVKSYPGATSKLAQTTVKSAGAAVTVIDAVTPSTGSVTGVSGSVTASKATAGTAVAVAKAGTALSIPNVTAAGSASTWAFSVDSNGLLTISGANGSAPTLGTAISVTPAISNGNITPQTFENVTVPKAATAATTVVTGITTDTASVAGAGTDITVATGALASNGTGASVMTGLGTATTAKALTSATLAAGTASNGILVGDTVTISSEDKTVSVSGTAAAQTWTQKSGTTSTPTNV